MLWKEYKIKQVSFYDATSMWKYFFVDSRVDVKMVTGDMTQKELCTTSRPSLPLVARRSFLASHLVHFVEPLRRTCIGRGIVYHLTCRRRCSGGQGGGDGGCSPRGWGWEKSHVAPSASGVSTKPPTHTLPPRFVFQVQANGQNAMIRLPPVNCGGRSAAFDTESTSGRVGRLM